MLSTRLFVTLSAVALVAAEPLVDFAVPVDAEPAVRPAAAADLYAPSSLTEVRGRSVRTRRQLPPLEQGNQVIDSIFQIPIGTLNAVGTLIKNTRPLVRRTRERIQQYYNSQQQPAAVSQQQQYYYSSGNRPTRVPASTSPYANRPYYNSYFNNNRRKQQRDDPLPQGRHGDGGDDY